MTGLSASLAQAAKLIDQGQGDAAAQLLLPLTAQVLGPADMGPLRLLLALAEAAAGRPAQGAAELLPLADIQGLPPGLLADAGGYALQWGQAEQAAVLLRAATVQAPDAVHAWNNLGIAAWQTGEISGAAAAFARAIMLMPDEGTFRLNHFRAECALSAQVLRGLLAEPPPSAMAGDVALLRPVPDLPVVIWPGFLTPEECARLERAAEADPAAKGQVGDGGVSPADRRSTLRWLMGRQPFEPIYRRMAQTILAANAQIWKLPLVTGEALQLAVYEGRDQGFYGWHHDVSAPEPGTERALSLSVQMRPSDDYIGGNLEFRTQGGGILPAPRAQGTAIIFPSRLLHRVAPVTQGVRASLVCWFAQAL